MSYVVKKQHIKISSLWQHQSYSVSRTPSFWIENLYLDEFYTCVLFLDRGLIVLSSEHVKRDILIGLG